MSFPFITVFGSFPAALLPNPVPMLFNKEGPLKATLSATPIALAPLTANLPTTPPATIKVNKLGIC